MSGHDHPLKALKRLYIPPRIKSKSLPVREGPPRPCPPSLLSLNLSFHQYSHSVLPTSQCGVCFRTWHLLLVVCTCSPHIFQGSFLLITTQASYVTSFKKPSKITQSRVNLFPPRASLGICLCCFLMTHIYTLSCLVELFRWLLPVFHSSRKAP